MGACPGKKGAETGVGVDVVFEYNALYYAGVPPRTRVDGKEAELSGRRAGTRKVSKGGWWSKCTVGEVCGTRGSVS